MVCMDLWEFKIISYKCTNIRSDKDDTTWILHRYAAVEEDIGALPVLRKLVANGHPLKVDDTLHPTLDDAPPYIDWGIAAIHLYYKGLLTVNDIIDLVNEGGEKQGFSTD